MGSIGSNDSNNKGVSVLQNQDELFEQISDEYCILLLNWAYKKTGSRAEAEDLSQEILAQVFRSAKKERHIEKLDNFIWKIAHFVWCNYLKKNTVLRTCVSIDAFDYDFLSEYDHTEKYLEQQELNDKIKIMRSKVQNLNYLQREIMIMHYIDEQPIKSIAEKLNITEANVKWHLYDTRKKLKREITEMNNTTNTEFVYRPGKLHMGLSGNGGPTPDVHKINESLTKQNIALCCYRESKTSGEIAEMLGIPKAYVEYDLEWLVERQFMKQENYRYTTMFSITGSDFFVKLAQIFSETKADFADVIVDKFMTKADKIKTINFHGSEQPMEKLLWLFIYGFISSTSMRVIYGENGENILDNFPVMPDGGQYFSLGFDKSESGEMERARGMGLEEKYKGIDGWHCNGPMSADAEVVDFDWMGLYNAGQHAVSELFFEGETEKRKRAVEIISKSFDNKFSVDKLNDEAKEVLGEMIEIGLVSKKDDKIVCNFAVFTGEQYEKLHRIYEETYEEMKDEISKMFERLQKLCRDDLPKHLDYYTNHHALIAFNHGITFVTGFALYDGKIHEPKNSTECGFLTLLARVGQ